MDRKDLTIMRVIRAGPCAGLLFETPDGPMLSPGGEAILLDNGMIHLMSDLGDDITTSLSRCDVVWVMGKPPSEPTTPEQEARKVTPMRRK